MSRATLHVWPNVALLAMEERLTDSAIVALRAALDRMREGQLAVFDFYVEVVTHPEPFPLPPEHDR